MGGHCIGVDPYYLTYKAQSIGFHPEVILSARRVNDGMASFVAHDIITSMIRRKMPVSELRVLIMGFTFKENCPDTRNTKVADVADELKSLVNEVVVYDPYADSNEALHDYGIDVQNDIPKGLFDAIVLAVRHDKIIGLGADGIRESSRTRTRLYIRPKRSTRVNRERQSIVIPLTTHSDILVT